MHSRNREELIVDNLPLVGYLVSSLCARATHLSRDDLASVGAIALITSADSFDPTLGVPFGAYARRRITGAFADEMRSWCSEVLDRDDIDIVDVCVPGHLHAEVAAGGDDVGQVRRAAVARDEGQRAGRRAEQ